MSHAIPKLKKHAKSTAIRRMEAASPAGDKLCRLVKKHPAPQQWYDQDADQSTKRSM